MATTPSARQNLVDEAGLRQTNTQYDDVGRTVTVSRDLQTDGDGQLHTVTSYDQLGRVHLVTGPNGAQVQTSYYMLTGGLCTVTSTPYLSFIDGTLEWTQTQYDVLNRVSTVSTFNSQPACQSGGNPTGVTQMAYDIDPASGLARTRTVDPAGKTRDTETDALGRTTLVVEDPGSSPHLNYPTSYTYDPLGNLKQVFQGSQVRSFAYDSLSRLTAASNPESGTATYAYYDSGDLNTRTDARQIITNYTYDGLHRVSTKFYTNDPFSTPAASYKYYLTSSGPTPNIGQLQSVTSTAGFMQYAYDALGRVTGTSQSITGYPGIPPFAYTYYLNDTLQTMTYPSGNVVNYSDDTAGRPVTVGTPTKTYADLTASTSSPLAPWPNGYAPDGRIAQVKLGNQLWETRNYQKPGPTTPTQFMLGTAKGANDYLELDYTWSGTQNNGNLASHTISQGPNHSWTQTYTYDALNRIAGVSEGSAWSQTFNCDPYSNCWVASATSSLATDVHQPTSSSNFDQTTNRLFVAGSGYDAAGNQILYTPFTLGYDAENRNTSTTSQGVGSGTDAYDADGRRIKKVWTAGSTTTTTYYFYDAFGNVAAEYSTNPIAVTGTTYLHTDLLGSVRMVTGDKPSSGNAPVLECYDYFPYGRMLNSNDNGRNTGCYPAAPDFQLSSVVSQKFTGKERDVETGLDNFLARYYSGAQGRFTSPDAPMADQDLENPQSWNLYSYGRNNPLVYTDPTGRKVRICFNGYDDCQELEDDDYERARVGNPGVILPSFKGNEVPSSSQILCGGNACGTAYSTPDVKGLEDTSFDLLFFLQGAHAGASIAKEAIAGIGTVFSREGLANLARTFADESGAVSFGDLTPRAIALARRFNINASSPVARTLLTNLDTTVDQFISQFRQAGIRGRIPGEFLGQTVEQALRSGNSTVRKLLLDARFAK